MRYQVTGDDGRTVEVEAFDWMMAMVHAIERWGLEVSGWACETRPDGTMHVADPMSGRSWYVSKAGGAEQAPTETLSGPTVAPALPGTDDIVADRGATPPPYMPQREGSPTPAFTTPQAAPDATPTPTPLRRGPSPMTISSFEDVPDATPTPVALRADPADGRRPSPVPAPRPAPLRPTRPAEPTAALDQAPPVAPPSGHLRAPTEAHEGPPDDLAERLFDLTMELSDATDGNDACRKALDICLQIVPCDAGSVLRGGLNDAGLTFVAVAGPAASQLLGRKLPFGRGIVGASFDLGITIGVDDVTSDPRHISDFDQETGFKTRSVLCVPVQGRQTYHGVIQLLNPATGRFVTWHRDTLEQLAASLASTLDGATR